MRIIIQSDSRAREFRADVEGPTWAEAMEAVFDGLLAMGYTLTREDFKEVFQEEFQSRLEVEDADR